MVKRLYPILIILLVLSAANVPNTTRAQDGFTPVFEPNACSMPIPDGYVEGETIICGTVAVPELHSDPTGKTIRLAVTVLKREGGAPDPLVMFNGGPGSNIMGLLSSMASPIGDPVTQYRDVVLMTERGTPGADPELICTEVATALEGQFGRDLNELNALKLTAYGACRERLIAEGVNLNAYNNPERAADVPLVMQALGYTEFNLWGVSGGGIMAQYVLREHPAGVRTVMTDSGSFPTAYIGDVFFNIYDVVSNAYRRMFETCAADALCSTTYPDLENVFWGVVDQLNATPVMVQISDPATGTTMDWPLTGDVVVSILGNAFADVEALPSVIYAMASGDYTYVVERVPGLYATDTDFADGMFQSVVCSETTGLTQETANTANAYPRVLAALHDFIQLNIDLCTLWDVEPVAEGAVIKSDVPILIMEGKYDANKPPEFGPIVAANYSTSYVVEFADTAHAVFGACALELMGQFMNDPYTAPDRSCAATETVFTMPGAELTFSEVEVASIGMTALIPDGWSEVDAGIYVNPNDGTVLVVTMLPGDDIEAAVAAFAAAVALPTLEKIGDVPIGEYTWTVYQVIDGDTGSFIGATSVNGSVYLTGIQTSAASLETAVNTILLPVTQSLNFGE